MLALFLWSWIMCSFNVVWPTCKKKTAPNHWLVCKYSHDKSCWNAHPIIFAVGCCTQIFHEHQLRTTYLSTTLGGTIPRINWQAQRNQHINWEPVGNPGINWGALEHHTTKFNGTSNPLHKFKSPRGFNYQLRSSKSRYVNWKWLGSRNINGEALGNQNVNWKT